MRALPRNSDPRSDGGYRYHAECLRFIGRAKAARRSLGLKMRRVRIACFFADHRPDWSSQMGRLPPKSDLLQTGTPRRDVPPLTESSC